MTSIGYDSNYGLTTYLALMYVVILWVFVRDKRSCYKRVSIHIYNHRHLNENTYNFVVLHGKPWIPGGEKSLFDNCF